MVRTCCGCGHPADKDQLVRLVIGADGQLLLDLEQRIPGRGAYLHPLIDCWRSKRMGGLLARSLRSKALLGGKPEQLQEKLRAALAVAMQGESIGVVRGGSSNAVREKLLSLWNNLAGSGQTEQV